MVSFRLSLFAFGTLVQALPSNRGGHGQSTHSTSLAQASSSTGATAADGLAQTTAIVDAANAFLALLTAEQNAAITFNYTAAGTATPLYFGNQNGSTGTPSAEKFGDSVWTNFPVSIVDRVGLKRENFTDAQDEAAMNMLKVIMSEEGYTKIQDIMGADQVEEDNGQDYEAGIGSYTLGIFGTPSVDDIWMVQFGGHHLAINMAMYQDQAVMAPILTGALPAVYTLNNVTKRVLAKENDIAFSLVGSLSTELFAQANITHDVSTLVLGPGYDGVEYITEGASVADFTEEQQSMVFDIVTLWAGILNPVHVASRLAEVQAGLNETYFAWSGPTTKNADENGKSYFRIKGPNVWVE